MRRTFAIVGLLLGMALAALLSGCSVGVNFDAFYPKGSEPREIMPWYGGASGDNNRNNVELHRFKKMGG